MARYDVRMKHTETTLTALAHMQYDLFCQKDKILRSCFAAGAFILGVMNMSQWWGFLLIAYGSYLMSSKYAAANRTASKLAQQLKNSGADYPSSRYLFEDSSLRILTLPEGNELDPLPYSAVAGLGEDPTAFFIFQNQYGGYMIPKAELGDKEDDFKHFLEVKTGKLFVSKRTRFAGLRQWMNRRSNEPPHL